MTDHTRAEIDLLRQGYVKGRIARSDFHSVWIDEAPLYREAAQVFPYPTTPRTFTRKNGVTFRVIDGKWQTRDGDDVWRAYCELWPIAHCASDARGLLDLWDNPSEPQVTVPPLSERGEK